MREIGYEVGRRLAPEIERGRGWREKLSRIFCVWWKTPQLRRRRHDGDSGIRPMPLRMWQWMEEGAQRDGFGGADERRDAVMKAERDEAPMLYIGEKVGWERTLKALFPQVDRKQSLVARVGSRPRFTSDPLGKRRKADWKYGFQWWLQPKEIAPTIRVGCAPASAAGMRVVPPEIKPDHWCSPAGHIRPTARENPSTMSGAASYALNPAATGTSSPSASIFSSLTHSRTVRVRTRRPRRPISSPEARQAATHAAGQGTRAGNARERRGESRLWAAHGNHRPRHRQQRKQDLGGPFRQCERSAFRWRFHLSL